jgi:hypothetical protein
MMRLRGVRRKSLSTKNAYFDPKNAKKKPLP